MRVLRSISQTISHGHRSELMVHYVGHLDTMFNFNVIAFHCSGHRG